MKRLFSLVVLFGLLSSCSQYQQIYRSEDMGLKNKTAEALYEAGKYKKALKLYDQIVPAYRGKPQAERVMFYYADIYYKLRDHYLAGYQFERFVKSYPKSDKKEEASYKAAKSFYYLSPRYSLDQADTDKALTKLQDFINTYPESEHVPEANKIVAELRNKLERKHYEIAKQYHHTESYKVAISAFDNFVIDYPGSRFREKALFYKLDAAYVLAINSLPRLVEERLVNARGYYDTYIKYYKEGEFVEKASEIVEDIDERLATFTNSENASTEN